MTTSNTKFLDRLDFDLRHDFLAYVRLHVGDPDKIDLTDATLIAKYAWTNNLGKWHSLERNSIALCRGTRTYKPYRVLIFEEDLLVMMNNAVLHNPKPTPAAAEEAKTRFAEATRQASFSLSLGIREIRLLADKPWEGTRWLQPEYTASLQRLLEKGLLIHEMGSPPRLSRAGELTRQLLIESRHIVERDV